MNCPTVDKLSQYVDTLLGEEELEQIEAHVESCKECQKVVEAFIEEQLFIKETLQTPSLPDDFATSVLDQLEPYKQQKRKPRIWKRAMLTAAGMVLAVGVSATLNPSFAEWLGGVFSTEQVDEGLRMANEANLTERVDFETTDKGYTLKVEDVFADASRVVLSYKVLNKNGKPIDIDLADIDHNEIAVVDQNGTKFGWNSMGGHDGSDYGTIEFSLREQVATDHLTIKLDIVELNGVKGDWKMEIPIDATKNRALTTTIPLVNYKKIVNGLAIQMNEARFSPSSTDLFYEMSFTEEEQEKMDDQREMLAEKYGKDIAEDATRYGSELQYHIENDRKEVIYERSTFSKNKVYSNDIGFMQGSGSDLDENGGVARNDSFVPLKENRPLTFVLEGVIKTVPADFTVTIEPKQLKKKPMSFEYAGNYLTVKKAENQTSYHLKKSLFPIGKEKMFLIEMEGEKDEHSPQLGTWIVVDDQGKAYKAYGNGGTMNEPNKNGRYGRTIELRVYGMDKVPEQMTLHLVSLTLYEEVEEKWEVPLTEKE